MKKVLTIAGSDPSGGAGIQADLKTMEAHGVYGMSVITALTAQNTLGVTGKFPVPADFVRRQLVSVFEDIFPDAVKVGMLPDIEVMRILREIITEYKPKKIVLDPVLSSTSGTSLSAENSLDYLKEMIFHLCTLITPNIPEAEKLTGFEITSSQELERVAKALGDEYGCSVLIKGGHSSFDGESSIDLLYSKGKTHRFRAGRIDNPNTHGTGCTLSSAIACNLALGFDLEESVKKGKDYLTRCIVQKLDIGKGRGPLEHRITKYN